MSRSRYLRLDRPHHSRSLRIALGDVASSAGWLPGHIAKTRGHPHAEAVTVAGWVTPIFRISRCGRLRLIWAYVDVPAARDTEAGRSIVAIFNVYLVLLFVDCASSASFASNLFWKFSPLIVLLLLNLFGLFIPDELGRAPQEPALVPPAQFRRHQSPDVAGGGDRGTGRPRTPRSGPAMFCFRIDRRCPTRPKSRGSEAQLKPDDAPGPDDAVVRAAIPDAASMLSNGSPKSISSSRAFSSKARSGIWNKTIVRAPDRWLCDQPRASQRCASGQPSAYAGDGIHRHLGYNCRRQSLPERCAISAKRPASR